MALRIGAILLASCQLLSGSVISLGNPNNVHLVPLGRIEQDSHHRVQHRSHDHSVVRVQKWSSPRQHQHRQADSSRHQEHRGERSSEKRVNIHRIQVLEPRPSVIVSGYAIGQNAVRGHHVVVDSDKIDVNKTPVRFNSLRYVEEDSSHRQVAKTPITVVTVPQISTAKTTQHKVTTNQVINQSNIPSVREHKNRNADKLLFNYDNLGRTKVQPITEVPEFRRTPTPQKVRSELVRPGKLEKVVATQLAIGQIRQNAPILINQYHTTATPRIQLRRERDSDCDSNYDHLPNHQHRVVIGLGH